MLFKLLLGLTLVSALPSRDSHVVQDTLSNSLSLTSLNPQLRSYPLDKRDLPTGTCNAATPCVNGACCGKDNLCGYSLKSCGTGCQHNCKSYNPEQL